MNLEHLFKLIKKNYHLLRNENATLNFLKYHIELLQWKKNKLKLGAIVFEVKETYFNEILLVEEVDIRYIRQDNTDTDELKLENRLKAIGWKWDMKNILAFLTVVFIFVYELYAYLRWWYYENLPTLAYRSEHFDYILKFGIENSIIPGKIGIFNNFTSLNYWLIETLTDFCIYFDMIF